MLGKRLLRTSLCMCELPHSNSIGVFQSGDLQLLRPGIVFQVLPRDESGEAEVSEGRLSVELCSSTCTNK